MYVYIPNDTLSRDDFSFHDAFKALGFQSPEQQLAFHCRGIFDYQQWNTRLPSRCPKKLVKNTQTQSKLFAINGVDLRDEAYLHHRESGMDEPHGPTEMEKAHQDHKSLKPGCDLCEKEKAHQDHKEFVKECDLCDLRHRTNHHQELVRDCFKRLIKGASKACKVLNAVYLSDTNWIPDRNTFMAQCLNEAAKVPRLGLCESKDLNPDLVNELIDHMKLFDEKYDRNSEENKKCHLYFNSTWWHEAQAKDESEEKAAQEEIESSKPQDGSTNEADWKIYRDKKDQHIKKSRFKRPEGFCIETIPDPGCTYVFIHNCLSFLLLFFSPSSTQTLIILLYLFSFISGLIHSNPHYFTTSLFFYIRHLIISEDRALLEKKFDEQIRSAMLLINGGPYLCQQFCNFFHQQRPVFIFKYSGGAADAAAYTLEVTR